MALAVLGIGLFGMGTGPSIQYRVVGLAGPGAPLASALPASAVNAGIAFGAFAGGIAIDGGGVPFAVVTGDRHRRGGDRRRMGDQFPEGPRRGIRDGHRIPCDPLTADPPIRTPRKEPSWST